jgi:nucleoside-diphosphate-sugar epimerase
MAKRQAVVTGAEGFIGSHLVRELLAGGWAVVALHRPGADLARLSGLPVTPAPCDILVPRDLERALPEQADAVFHLAADLRLSSKRRQSQSDVNVSGTSAVADWALRRRCRRFVFVSSMAAFGLHAERISEATPSNALQVPINYFRSKYLAELEVESWVARGLDAVIVNPANVVGPGDSRSIAAVYIRLIHQASLPFASRGAASFCHVREVARALVGAAERGRTGERYLLGGADATFLDLGRLIEGMVGGRAPRFVMPGPLLRAIAGAFSFYARRTDRPTYVTPEIALSISSRMLVDCSKAIRELGYRPAPLEEMFRDAAAWLADNGLLDAEPFETAGPEAAPAPPSPEGRPT